MKNRSSDSAKKRTIIMASSEQGGGFMNIRDFSCMIIVNNFEIYDDSGDFYCETLENQIKSNHANIKFPL